MDALAMTDMDEDDGVLARAAEIVRKRFRLTSAECRVMLLRVSGHWTAKHIGRHLDRSDRTIEVHMTRVRDKLGAANFLHAALIFDRALRATIQEDNAMPGQYAVTVRIEMRDDGEWHTASDEMPRLTLRHDDAGVLARQVVNAFAEDYRGKNAVLTVVVGTALTAAGEGKGDE